MDKRKALAAQQSRWMADRESTLAREGSGSGPGQQMTSSAASTKTQGSGRPTPSMHKDKAMPTQALMSSSGNYSNMSIPTGQSPRIPMSTPTSSSTDRERMEGSAGRYGRYQQPSHVPASYHNQHQYQQPTSGAASAEAGNDEFIDKLTQKLSRNIRDEVKRELAMTTHSSDIRDAIAEQMSGYLVAELGTHTCKICSSLMTSPNNTPILLFPCGHTFCRAW
jgi:hypothetical protein